MVKLEISNLTKELLDRIIFELDHVNLLDDGDYKIIEE